MKYQVYFTDDAVIDLEEIYDYIYTNDHPLKAEQLLNNIEQACLSLKEQPTRGSFVKELLALGIHEFREIFFKPYRIIYKQLEKNIYIYLVADGRRDMQTLLERRLLQ